MTFPYGQTVTLLKRVLSGRDEYGNDEYTNVSEPVSGCVVQPAASTENIQFTDQVDSGVTVFLPYGTDVSYLDALVIGGQKYEVQGVPGTWTSPFSGRSAPVQVSASRVSGVSA
jgi:hypothetical protein